MKNQKIFRRFLGVLALLAGIFAGATNVRAEWGQFTDMMQATKYSQRQMNLLNDIMNMQV